ncbi:MAG TPA: type II CRISPR-associated endonuclease Cas1 [Bacteroidetes bacterium]|nr:type II CRISPR-associated endonuclease Cas1 [Bacteroidota bacterium]
MIKRTLLFSNPYYLSTRNEQLVISNRDKKSETSQPIEDLGYLVLDHPQITVSYTAMQKLAANNVAVIYCNEKHLPASMLLSLDAHYTQNERFRIQLEASEPLKKQLWKQTVEAKIGNQAKVLQKFGGGEQPLLRFAREVKSGDPTNREGQAARHYWKKVFAPLIGPFKRERFGPPPNNLLNYGYALLRAATARALAGTGLLCTLGIHHHNRYNAFALADDIMEPYRPFVDELVMRMLTNGLPNEDLSTEDKASLLRIFAIDTKMPGQFSPLMIALNKTASSLVQCFEGTKRKIIYPEILAH